MYRELGSYLRCMLRAPSLWKDGELWTAVAAGVGSYFWFHHDPSAIVGIRRHFGDLLAVTSIVFGFVLAALLFYIQAAGAWGQNKRVVQTANLLVDWHVWTIVTMLVLIGYGVALWAVGKYLNPAAAAYSVLHAVLVFLVLYCGFQILNHTLTVWWIFRNRHRLDEQPEQPAAPESAKKPEYA